MHIWQQSAREIARQVRSGAVSAQDVVEAHLKRIEEVNPRLNAVTVSLDEQAIRSAQSIDQMLAEGQDPGPLAGVPMTVKENIDLAGSATTQGVTALENLIPPDDAPHIAQLKRAGAIPIARTNMPDFGLRWHTDSVLRGATQNPWDEQRTSGGSSAGDGVALATGMTAIGMGNDYGGSVRIPAFCNGITALRPTRGRVPRIANYNPNGRTTRSITSQMFSVHGPMARHVGDLRLALEHMIAPDPRDSAHRTMPLYGEVPPQPMKIAVIEDPDTDPVIAASIRLAADTLSDAGYQVETCAPPDLMRVVAVYTRMVRADIEHLSLPLMRQLAGDDAIRFIELFLEESEPVTLAEELSLFGEHHLLANDWSEFMAEYPLLLGAVMTQKPFLVGADLQDTESAATIRDTLSLTVSVNCLGLPSVAVPVALDAGLPQGVQIVGQAFREDLCLQAAEAIEDRLGVFTPINLG